MQKFEFLRQPLLGELAMSRKKKREREKNALYSGHLHLCQQPRAAHAIRSDQQLCWNRDWIRIGCRVAITVQSSYEPDFDIYILPTFCDIPLKHFVPWSSWRLYYKTIHISMQFNAFLRHGFGKSEHRNLEH